MQQQIANKILQSFDSTSLRNFVNQLYETCSNWTKYRVRIQIFNCYRAFNDFNLLIQQPKGSSKAATNHTKPTLWVFLLSFSHHFTITCGQLKFPTLRLDCFLRFLMSQQGNRASMQTWKNRSYRAPPQGSCAVVISLVFCFFFHVLYTFYSCTHGGCVSIAYANELTFAIHTLFFLLLRIWIESEVDRYEQVNMGFVYLMAYLTTYTLQSIEFSNSPALEKNSKREKSKLTGNQILTIFKDNFMIQMGQQ